MQDEQISSIESDYLYTKDSQIPNAGKGLYTAIDIYQEEIIAYFKGEILTEEEEVKRKNAQQDAYFMNLIDGRTLDANHIECFAKYANDAEGPGNHTFKNNAKISLDDDNEICLIATENIKAGAEIFCAYGENYWSRLKNK